MSGDFGVNRSKEEIGREGKVALLCYAHHGRCQNDDGLDQLKLSFLALSILSLFLTLYQEGEPIYIGI